MSSSSAASYLTLLRAFVEGRLTPTEFETLYLFMFKNDPGGRDPETYQVLNALFAEVDAFCDDAELRAETSDGIGSDELRRAAEIARQELTR